MTKNYDWQQKLPLEDQQIREVFACFGLAAYYAQCVERQIGILLATVYNPNFFNSSVDERNEIFEKQFSKTLGRLVTKLQQRVDLHSDPVFNVALNYETG